MSNRMREFALEKNQGVDEFNQVNASKKRWISFFSSVTHSSFPTSRLRLLLAIGITILEKKKFSIYFEKERERKKKFFFKDLFPSKSSKQLERLVSC